MSEAIDVVTRYRLKEDLAGRLSSDEREPYDISESLGNADRRAAEKGVKLGDEYKTFQDKLDKEKLDELRKQIREKQK